MNSSFQLLKGKTDGEKSTFPAEHQLFFQEKTVSAHSEERKPGFNTHQRSIQIPNLLALQEKGNVASPVDAAVSPSILYISECALDFLYRNDINGSGLVKYFRFTSRGEFVVN